MPKKKPEEKNQTEKMEDFDMLNQFERFIDVQVFPMKTQLKKQVSVLVFK